MGVDVDSQSRSQGQRVTDAERQLAAAHARYRHLIERLPAVTYIADFGRSDSGPCIYVSPQVEDMLGFTPEEWLGDELLWTRQLHPADRERVKREEAASRETGRPFTSEYRFIRRDGSTIWVRDEAVAYVDEVDGRKYFHGMMFDISEAKSLQERALEAQKLEAVAALAAGAAHNFNNLLTIIRTYTESAMDELSDDTSVREDLEEVVSAAERAREIVRRLSYFTQQQEVEGRGASVNEVVTRTVDLLAASWNNDIRLRTHLDPHSGSSVVPEHQIEEILLNLSFNAREAMPEGGVLSFETAFERVDADRARASQGLSCGDYAVVRVSDTGVGMSEEIRRRIFEPFFTTRSKAVARGLGLATVYGLLKQWAGYISVSSEENAGSTFELFLPRTP
ncbi:MAG TPA: PAS domain-containing protein [Actinomycetota bacterium]|nr:PAS domain-containing protein [Actinomycetota bacterium]